MRFASLGASNAANYAQAGKAVADSSAKVFDVQRKTGPDYAGLSQVAMRTQSEEKQTAMKTAAKVTVEGIRQLKNKTEMQHKKAVFDDAKERFNSRRKAGAVAAIGKIGAAAVLTKDNTKGRERPTADFQSFWDKYKAERDALTQRQDAEMDGLGNFKSEPFQAPSGGNAGKASSGGGLTSSAQAVNAGKGTTGGGSKADLSTMTNYAIQAGFSPENARTMAAISMGESGGNPKIDTVMSGLDPNKSNEYSIGLAQINVQAHGDKLARRGWTAEDLRDPAKNMVIAKEVFDEAGSFRPWSVYQKGLHRQYLN